MSEAGRDLYAVLEKTKRRSQRESRAADWDVKLKLFNHFQQR